MRWFVLSALLCLPATRASLSAHITSYPSVFFTPSQVLNNEWFKSSHWAHDMIRWWSGALIQRGPWSVTNKTVVARNGDIHEYLSYAVYFWPNCTGVHNTTELTQEQVWDECKYYQRDGVFNPDIHISKDSQQFGNMSDSVYLAALAYAATGESLYSQHINDALHTFFVNNATAMNPDWDYSQVVRGPGNQTGKHTGVLDGRGLTKVVSAVELMKASGAKEWESSTEVGLTTWATQQVAWLETSQLALDEKGSLNNHATFYYNQLVSLYVLLNQTSKAISSLNEFYNSTFPGQIDADGDQPLESIRTRPFHYRAFNLRGLTVLAELGDYVGLSPSGWNRTTTAGGSLHDALVFAMNQNPADHGEENASKQLNPTIAAWVSRFGDPTGNLTSYLAATDELYPRQPWYALNAGISDSGIRQGIIRTTYESQPSASAVTGRRRI